MTFTIQSEGIAAKSFTTYTDVRHQSESNNSASWRSSSSDSWNDETISLTASTGSTVADDTVAGVNSSGARKNHRAQETKRR